MHKHRIKLCGCLFLFFSVFLFIQFSSRQTVCVSVYECVFFPALSVIWASRYLSGFQSLSLSPSPFNSQ